jgi:lipoyl synthase
MAKKPEWLRVKLASGANFQRLHGVIHGKGLHTVCEEALCPNMGRCWDHGRATLMILGGVCTRSCRFCNVTPGSPAACDEQEPWRCAEAVADMGLTDVVITSVTRDDLPDGGAAIWAETIRKVRERVPGITVEVLVPDFDGNEAALDLVIDARPEVFGHNLETVPSLYPVIRPQARYERSLAVLRRAAQAGRVVKSGIMLGLGETAAEVDQLMLEARTAGVDIFYIGQYLQPSSANAPVVRYVEPSEFDALGRRGREIGFGVVVSAPLVRSSFHSDDQAAYLQQRLGGKAPHRGTGFQPVLQAGPGTRAGSPCHVKAGLAEEGQ